MKKFKKHKKHIVAFFRPKNEGADLWAIPSFSEGIFIAVYAALIITTADLFVHYLGSSNHVLGRFLVLLVFTSSLSFIYQQHLKTGKKK